MNLLQLKVFDFAVIRGFMPLGVAQFFERNPEAIAQYVIRGFMPLGVA